MNRESQFHVAATISTGGAANEMSVPPMEMFAKRVPRAKYFALSGTRDEPLREPQIPCLAIVSRIFSIARDGASPLGHTSVQFMMVRQRKSR